MFLNAGFFACCNFPGTFNPIGSLTSIVRSPQSQSRESYFYKYPKTVTSSVQRKLEYIVKHKQTAAAVTVNALPHFLFQKKNTPMTDLHIYKTYKASLADDVVGEIFFFFSL